MAYKSKSILTIVKEIESSIVYLPALQRKFVWGKPQIELLFDSLIRNFPIGVDEHEEWPDFEHLKWPGNGHLLPSAQNIGRLPDNRQSET